MPRELSSAGREEVALALILLRDFKSEGRFDVDVTRTILVLADHLGVRAEYERLLPHIPPMHIEPRA